MQDLSPVEKAVFDNLKNGITESRSLAIDSAYSSYRSAETVPDLTLSPILTFSPSVCPAIIVEPSQSTKSEVDEIFGDLLEMDFTELLQKLTKHHPGLLYQSTLLHAFMNPYNTCTVFASNIAEKQRFRSLNHALDPYIASSLAQCKRAVLARGGWLDIAQLMMENHWISNESDYIGNTPLHISAALNLPDLCQKLLDNGANVATKTNVFDKSKAPIHRAVECDHPDIVKLLLNHNGHCINHLDGNGDTPLHLAARHGNMEIAKLLVACGANPHVRNANVLSRQMLAFTTVVTLLVFAPFPIIYKASRGNFIRGDSVSALAKRKKHVELYNYLKGVRKTTIA